MTTGAKVLWHITMSLDGFIAAPRDAMDWMSQFVGPNPDAEEAVLTTGAVVLGRRIYDVAVSQGGKVYGSFTGPQFVMTSHPEDAPNDPGFSFVSGPVVSVVEQALVAARGGNVLVLGAETARRCIAAGVVDEILVHLVPLLLGDGVRLFGGPGQLPVALEHISMRQAGQVTNLRYRVKRAA